MENARPLQRPVPFAEPDPTRDSSYFPPTKTKTENREHAAAVKILAPTFF